MRSSLFLAVTILCLSGCSNEAARVGGVGISQKDMSYRMKVSEIFYPGSGKEYVALSQLIKGHLSGEILKSLGGDMSGKAIEGESKRIDEHTKRPGTLQNIKNVFGKDKRAYLKTFVLPVYAERALHQDIFLKSPYAKKRQYDDWFWEHASAIPVIIHDSKLKDELLKKVSWARNLRIL